MRVPAPTLATAPTVEELAAVACPIERARLVTAFARACGTLPGALARLRQADLTTARRTTKVVVLAGKVGVSVGRICQLTSTARPDAVAAASGPTPTEGPPS